MKTFLFLVAALLSAVSARAYAKESASTFRRGDLVVMGYTSTKASEMLDEDGISSAITADLHISKVIRGRAPSQTLTVRYVAHADFRTDRPLRLHLRQTPTGKWFVCNDGEGQGYICK